VQREEYRRFESPTQPNRIADSGMPGKNTHALQSYCEEDHSKNAKVNASRCTEDWRETCECSVLNDPAYPASLTVCCFLQSYHVTRMVCFVVLLDFGESRISQVNCCPADTVEPPL